MSDPLWEAVGERLRDSVSASLAESVGDLLPRAGRLYDLLRDPYRPFADSARFDATAGALLKSLSG